MRPIEPMSHDLTNSISSTPDVPAREAVRDDLALRVERLLAQYCCFELSPVSNPDGSVIFLDPQGEVAAELYPDGSVYVSEEECCMSVEELSGLVHEEEEPLTIDEIIAFFEDHFGDDLPEAPDDAAGGKEMNNTAKKFSDSSEPYVQPLVSDNLPGNADGVEIKKVSEIIEEEKASEAVAAPSDADAVTELSKHEDAPAQAPASTPPEGIIASAQCFIPDQAPVEFELPAAIVHPSDVMSLSGAMNDPQAVKAMSIQAKADGGTASASSTADASELLLAGGAKALFPDDEKSKKAHDFADQIPVSGALAERASDAEVEQVIDKDEPHASDLKHGLSQADHPESTEAGPSSGPFFADAGSKSQSSSDPFAAGAKAVHDSNADPMAIAFAHANKGGPPYFSHVSSAIAAVSLDDHISRNEVAPAHHKGDSGRDQEGEEKGNSQKQQDGDHDSEEEEGSVSAIA